MADKQPSLVQAPEQSTLDTVVEAGKVGLQEGISFAAKNWLLVKDVVLGTEGTSIDEFNVLAKGYRKYEDGVEGGVEWQPGLSKEQLQFRILALKQNVTATYLTEKGGVSAAAANFAGNVIGGAGSPENVLAAPVVKLATTGAKAVARGAIALGESRAAVRTTAEAVQKAAARTEQLMVSSRVADIPKQAAIETVPSTAIGVATDTAEGQEYTAADVLKRAGEEFAGQVLFSSAVAAVRKTPIGELVEGLTPDDVARMQGAGLYDGDLPQGTSLVSMRPEDWREPHLVDAVFEGHNYDTVKEIERTLDSADLNGVEVELPAREQAPAPEKPVKAPERISVPENGTVLSMTDPKDAPFVRYALQQIDPVQTSKKKVRKDIRAYKKIMKAVPEFNPRRSEHLDALQNVLQVVRDDIAREMDEVGVPERKPMEAQDYELDVPTKGYATALRAEILAAEEARLSMDKAGVDEDLGDEFFDYNQEAALDSQGWIAESDMRIAEAVKRGDIDSEQGVRLTKIRDMYAQKFLDLLQADKPTLEWRKLAKDMVDEVAKIEALDRVEGEAAREMLGAAMLGGGQKGDVGYPLVNEKMYRKLRQHATEIEMDMIDRIFGMSAQKEAKNRLLTALGLEEGPDVAATRLVYALGDPTVVPIGGKRFTFFGRKGLAKRQGIPGVPKLDTLKRRAKAEAVRDFHRIFNGDPAANRFFGRINKGDKLAERLLHKEMWELGSSGDADANRFAKAYKLWFKDKQAELRKAGKNVGEIDNYTLRDYSPAQILAKQDAFDAWGDRLDMQRVMTRDPREYMAASRRAILGWEAVDPNAPASYSAKQRMIHFLTEEDDWNFWMEFGTDNNMYDLMLATMQRVNTDAALTAILGPHHEATLKDLVNEVANSYRVNGEPATAKAFQAEMNVAVDVLLGRYDNPMNGGSAIARNWNRMRQLQYTAMTSETVKYMLNDFVRVMVDASLMNTDTAVGLAANMPRVFYDAILSWGHAVGLDARDFATRHDFFKAALDKIPQSEKARMIEELGAAQKHLGATFYHVQAALDDAHQAPSAGERMVDQALNTLSNTVAMLQQNSQILEGLRHFQADNYRKRTLDALMESEGEMARLVHGTESQKQMAERLRRAGIGVKQWRKLWELYKAEADVDDDGNVLSSVIVEELEDGRKALSLMGLDISDPVLANLYRNYLHQSMLRGTEIQGTHSKNIRLRGGFVPSYIFKSPFGDKAHYLADVLAEFTMTQLVQSTQLMQNLTSSGWQRNSAAGAAVIVIGTAMLVQQALMSGDYDITEIMGDLDDSVEERAKKLWKFLTPTNVAAIANNTGAVPLSAQTWANFVNARTSRIGLKAPGPLEGLISPIEELSDRPTLSLLAGSAQQLDKAFEFGVFTGANPMQDPRQSKPASSVFVDHFVPSLYWARAIGIKSRDWVQEQIDPTGFVIRKVGRERARARRKSYGSDIIFMGWLQGGSRLTDFLFKDEAPAYVPSTYQEGY